MSFNDKETAGFDSRANEMLRGLNNQYKADKFAEKYSGNAEYVKAGDGSIQIDISTLSDEEFKVLFDSYIVASKMSVNDMTAESYKTLQHHIISLQKKSGAMLVTEDEMEKRFADAQRASVFAEEDAEEADEPVKLPEIVEDEDDELFGATTEFIQPEAAMKAAYAAEKAGTAATATATDVLPTEEIIRMSEDEIQDAEIIKKRRISIFSRLKSLLRDGEEEHEVEAEEVDVQEPEISAVPEEEDEDIEGATTEFITPFAAEREAVAASEQQAPTPYANITYDQEDVSPEEEMLENHLDDTSELPSYEPEISKSVEFEAPLEIPEEKEVPSEIVPEAPADIPADEGEAEVLNENTEIIDAFEDSPEDDRADVPKHIFDETTVETAETEIEEEEDPEETDAYVSFDQNTEVLQEYKHKYNSVRVRMGISAAIALLLLVFENIGIFGIQLPDFMLHKAFSVPFEWTMIVVSGSLVCDTLWGALKKLFKFSFEPATVTLVAFVLSAAATISTFFNYGSEPKFFNFPFALCVFLNLLSIYFALRKEIFSFKIISTAKKKHAVTLMKPADAAPEAGEFADYLSEDAQFYRVGETEFVDGYFAKKKHAPKMYKKLRVVLPLAFAAAAAATVVSMVLNGAGVYEGLVNGYLTFMMCAPVAVFFANELPMYLSTVSAYSHNSAILGDCAPEMMEKMSTVSFTDKDVFLPGDSVRIKGVKVIGSNRIDNIIYYATSVFELVGGPLAKVFKQASLENGAPESAEVRVISSKGIDAMVDGKHIVLGVHQFMDAQCFNPIREAGDEKWDGKTNKRILYLACNEDIIAKFYVEYNVNPEFVYLVKKLAKAGVCVGVRTNDPCVDIDIFAKNKLTPEQYPFRVIKGADVIEESVSVAASKTGLVAAGSLKGLIKTILVCDRLRNVQRTNFVVKTVAAAIGLLVMGFLIGMGISVFGAWSLYFALYQLLWLVPVYIISKINI